MKWLCWQCCLTFLTAAIYLRNLVRFIPPMILPTKHLPVERALLNVGGVILELLQEPKTVSRLWNDLHRGGTDPNGIPYDWFILGLDLLHIVNAVEFLDGRVRKVR